MIGVGQKWLGFVDIGRFPINDKTTWDFYFIGPVMNIYILITVSWKRQTPPIYDKPQRCFFLGVPLKTFLILLILMIGPKYVTWSISRPLIGREDCLKLFLSTKEDWGVSKLVGICGYGDTPHKWQNRMGFFSFMDPYQIYIYYGSVKETDHTHLWLTKVIFLLKGAPLKTFKILKYSIVTGLKDIT